MRMSPAMTDGEPRAASASSLLKARSSLIPARDTMKTPPASTAMTLSTDGGGWLSKCTTRERGSSRSSGTSGSSASRRSTAWGVSMMDRLSPSGIIGGNGLPFERVGRPATLNQIRGAIEAYGAAACTAKALGFDGVEIHGAHGYLIDQFLWDQTNRREDEYGGDIGRRTRFAAEVIQEIRANVGPDFPVVLRLSTWKQQDYSARLAANPEEWAAIVRPLAGAGVDAFHLSQRRYWEGEFGTEANLATWTKRLTGKPTITVGSITLDNSMAEMMRGEGSLPENNLAPLLARLERGDFDLVAVGRALIANPDWPHRVRNGTPLVPYSLSMLQTLV